MATFFSPGFSDTLSKSMKPKIFYCYDLLCILQLFIYPILYRTNIFHPNTVLKMIFLFPRWDMLVLWRLHVN